MPNNSQDLIVPVYLNQRLVFDLVAMLQGGIATVTQVIESHRDSEQLGVEASGGFALSQALSSLLKVNLSGKVSAESEGAVERMSTAERIHTPASLFFVLRNLLVERGVLHEDMAESAPVPGQFVQFTASLRRNPLIEGLESMIELMNLMTAFSEPERRNQSGGKRQQGSGQTDPKRMLAQMRSLAEALKAGGTQDLIADLVPQGNRAVLTVEQHYLADPLLSDLVDGTFKVVGKVTRTVNSAAESISLLRKTAMSRMPVNMLEALTKVFASLQTEHGFAMPTMDVEIRGPVIQVLPIAIFA